MALERYDPKKAERLRYRLADAVLSEGVLPAGSKEPVAVEDVQVGGRHTFALAGRLVVDAKDAERAMRLLDLDRPPRPLSPRYCELDLPSGFPVEAAIAKLAGDPDGLLARPHHVVFGAQIFAVRIREGQDPEPVDPLDDLAVKAGAPSNVRVAVVDNGIAETALSTSWLGDLASAPGIAGEIDPLDEWGRRRGMQRLTMDEGAGHGTFVAGLIRKAAPTAGLHILRRLDSRGVGTEADLADGIRAAVASGAQVVNLSVGCYTADGMPPALLEEAVAEAAEKDVVLVAAAGNEATNEPVWPAALRPVVAVGALAPWNPTAWRIPRLAPYSNRGWWVDVSLAGEHAGVFVHGQENEMIELDGVADRFKGWAVAGGTSFAAAAFSGLVAAELAAGAPSARQAVRRVVRRPGAVRIAGGGIAIPG